MAQVQDASENEQDQTAGNPLFPLSPKAVRRLLVEAQGAKTAEEGPQGSPQGLRPPSDA